MKQKGILFGLVAGMLWGFDGTLVGQIQSGESFWLSTILYSCIHDGFAAIWLFLFNARQGKAKEYVGAIRSKGFAAILLCAAVGGTAGTALNISAIRLAGAATTCAVTCAYPAVGALMGIVFLKERCSAAIFAGIGLTVAGAFLISCSGTVSANGVGIAFGLGAMLCWASEGTLSKKATQHLDPDVATGLRELLSFGMYFIILCFLVLFGKRDIFSGFEMRNTIFTVSASACGAFSYLCWYRSMNRVGVAKGMSLNATYVLWAMAFESILTGRMFSARFIISAVLILCGTIFTIYNGKEE